MFTNPYIYCPLLVGLCLLLFITWDTRKSKRFEVSSADGQRHFCRTAKSAADVLSMMLLDSSYDTPYAIVDTSNNDNKVSVVTDGFHAYVQCDGIFIEHQAYIFWEVRKIGYSVSKF